MAVDLEANKAVVRRLFEEGFNAGRLEVVDELVAPDVAVVRGVDAVDRVVDRAPFGVADERVAQEPGQVVGMAAEPDAQHEQHRRQAGEHDEQRLAGPGRRHGPRRLGRFPKPSGSA